MKTLFICALMLLVAIPSEARKKDRPTLTAQEIKIMTTKQYDCPKKLVIRGALSLLQAEGFMIEDTNLEIGLIKASKRIEADKKKARGSLLWRGKSIDANTAKFTIYIDELNDQLCDVRITIYDGVEMTIAGGNNTRSNKTSEEMVQDAEVYSLWFSSLSAEIERLKALQ